MLTQSIYTILTNSAALDGWVGRFTPLGSADEFPAIFTDTVPHDAPLPMVTSIGNSADNQAITAGPVFRTIDRDITLVAAASSSAADLEDVANSLYAELWQSQALISETGYATIAFHPVLGPRRAPTDENLRAVILSVRARLQRG